MKKYIFALLALIIIMTLNSIVKAGFPPECENKINQVMKNVDGFKDKNLQQVLKDGTWGKFKLATGITTGGIWDTQIVPACCSPCADTGCKTCPCDGNDPCTWKCRCCWGTTACSSLSQ